MGEFGTLPVFRGVDVLNSFARQNDGSRIGGEESVMDFERGWAEPVKLSCVMEPFGEILRAGLFKFGMKHFDPPLGIQAEGSLNREGKRGDAEGEIKVGLGLEELSSFLKIL